MSINQRQPKFNLSAHISVKESQKLKINCFFPSLSFGIDRATEPGGWGGGAGTAHKQNAAVGQTEACPGPYLVQHEAEDTALPPTKQTLTLF